MEGLEVDDSGGAERLTRCHPRLGLLGMKPEPQGIDELRIVDLLGRTLMKQKVRAFVGSTEFDVSDLPRGIVMVEFTTGVRKFTKKVRLD